MEFATNAILAALLTQASAFVNDLGTPIQTPLEPSKVRAFSIIVHHGREGPQLSCYLGYAGGYEFRHGNGAILSFDTLDAYYRLQDPKEAVRLLGEARHTEAECLARARQAIRSLGYTNVALIEREPRGRSPRFTQGGLGIPRFIFEWVRKEPGYAMELTDARVEVNSSNLAIEDLSLMSREFWREPWPTTFGTTNSYEEPDPTEATRPDLEVRDVSREYALAFIRAVLPEINSFCAKLGTSIPAKIDESQIVIGASEVALKRGRLAVSLRLKTGHQVVFWAGHVWAVHTRDALENAPAHRKYVRESREYRDPIALSRDEAVQKVRRILLDELKLPAGPLFLDAEPACNEIDRTEKTGVRRYCFRWQPPETAEQRDYRRLNNILPVITVSAEVDAVSGEIKGINFIDKYFERPDPKIDVPVGSGPPSKDPLDTRRAP